jgi:hypothetical protein
LPAICVFASEAADALELLLLDELDVVVVPDTTGLEVFTPELVVMFFSSNAVYTLISTPPLDPSERP